MHPGRCRCGVRESRTVGSGERGAGIRAPSAWRHGGPEGGRPCAPWGSGLRAGTQVGRYRRTEPSAARRRPTCAQSVTGAGGVAVPRGEEAGCEGSARPTQDGAWGVTRFPVGRWRSRVALPGVQRAGSGAVSSRSERQLQSMARRGLCVGGGSVGARELGGRGAATGTHIPRSPRVRPPRRISPPHARSRVSHVSAPPRSVYYGMEDVEGRIGLYYGMEGVGGRGIL